MKVEKIEGSKQRQILIAMITNRSVLARIASRWEQDGLFASPYENMIANWCIRYFKKYDKSPGKHIEEIFADWAAKRDSDDTVKMIDKFLSSLSDAYEVDAPSSDEYIIDLAGAYFNYARVKMLVPKLESDLEAFDGEAAHKRLEEFRRVDLGILGIESFNDYEFIASACEGDDNRPLIEYPGALGDFVGPEFSRDSFVAIMASSKRGKTWWLIDLAFRGVKARRRVAYFECGDLSKKQLARRFCQRILRRPRYPKTVWIPNRYESIKEGPSGEESQLLGITPNEAFKAWEKVQQGEQMIRLSCHSNGTLTMAVLDGLLKEWAKDGWVADVVVIDYADLLAPPIGMRADERESINENWKYLRRISQDLHCLVITATQADAESYDRNLLTRRNFSGDRRKHDHVTAMLALNATDEDKKRGVTRVNFLDRREAEYTETAQVYVAGCLAIGNPIIKSTRWEKEENDK